MSGVIVGAAIAASTAANMYQGKRQSDRAEAAERRQQEAMEKAEQIGRASCRERV